MRVHADDASKTARQWAKEGFLPKDGAIGALMWTNQWCQKTAEYFYPEQVEKASESQIKEFQRPERERKAARSAELRALRREERERKRAESRGFTVIIDTETTGLNPESDELLQVSIISADGVTLFDSLFRPSADSWDAAEAVNHISPAMVADAPSIGDKITEINEILERAETIIGYNVNFDLNFLRQNGAYIRAGRIIDVMKHFAEIYGEWNTAIGFYKWQKLTTAAAYYGYDWNNRPEGAHNSLADCYATLYVYQHITAEWQDWAKCRRQQSRPRPCGR